MAKSSRSKTRKFWASERRRTLGVPAEMKQLEEQARKLQDSIQTQSSQPSILKLKAVFKRPQAFSAQPRRPAAAAAAKPKAEKATPKPAAMEAEAPPAVQEEEEVVAVDMMDVDAKRAKGRKPRAATRVKKSGVKFAAKKQKGVKK